LVCLIKIYSAFFRFLTIPKNPKFGLLCDTIDKSIDLSVHITKLICEETLDNPNFCQNTASQLF
jgi:hypothetical protein